MLAIAIIVGVVTDEPSLRTYPKGSRLQFTLRRERPSGEEHYTIVAWRATAQRLAPHIQMGQTLLVIGELAIQQWKDERGHWHRRVELTAESVRELPCAIDPHGQPMNWSYRDEIVDQDQAAP